MEERRRSPRKQAKMPLRFRLVREGAELQMSEPVEATIRDINMEGLSMETPIVVVDGIHISYNDHPARKNRVYLQWELPSGKSIKAVAQTAWYERTAIEGSTFLAGLRFLEISQEDREALRQFLEIVEDDAPIKV